MGHTFGSIWQLVWDFGYQCITCENGDVLQIQEDFFVAEGNIKTWRAKFAPMGG